jgi:hypothetical protein
VRSQVSTAQAAEDLKLIFAQVNASVAKAAPADTFAARVAREARLDVAPGNWGGLSGVRTNYERWLRLL